MFSVLIAGNVRNGSISAMVLANVEAAGNGGEGQSGTYERQEERFKEESYSGFRPCDNNPDWSVACGGIKYTDYVDCLGVGNQQCTPSTKVTKMETWTNGNCYNQ